MSQKNQPQNEFLSMSQLRQIEKVDLHRHLDCSMRWSTVVEIAKTLGFAIENKKNLKKEFLIAEPMVDLESVLRKFLTSQKLLASEEILERLAFEACEDAFNDGVKILELRYAPGFILEGHSQLSYSKIHQAFKRGIVRAQQKWPMAVGLIGIIQRIKSADECAKVMDFIVDHSTEFIGVDLADQESAAEISRFAPLFAKAKKSGLRITIHSGETPDPKSPLRVQDSIDILGAERIGHGVQIIHDQNVINYIKKKGVTLEVCPWSNILTSAFPRPEDHPLRSLWNQGVPMTFNSDDPGIFDSTLSDDYQILQKYHGFDLEMFNKANHIAANASFISKDLTSKVWNFV